MQPDDLALFRSYGRPAITRDGWVTAALVTPDVEADRYDGVLHGLDPAGSDGPATPLQLSRGPRDTSPVVSPNGALVVFLRAGASGPSQLYAMARDGGEPFQLADHPLGARAVTFSPDGRRIAYLAAVPEAGRYRRAVQGPDGAATDEIPADAEAPRRVTTLAYRSDARGFTADQREQIFVLDLLAEDGSSIPDSVPRRLTAEQVPIGRPSFTPDGSEIVYSRTVDADSLQSEIAAVRPCAPEPTVGRSVVIPGGDAALPVVVGDTLYYIGALFRGHDYAGRTPGLWSVPFAGGVPRRLTDTETVHVDGDAGEPVAWRDSILVAVADRGAVEVRAVPVDAVGAALDTLPVVVGGQRVVRSFTAVGDRLAAAVADPHSCGDIVTGDIGDLLAHGSATEVRLTDASGPLRESVIAPILALDGTGPDGQPVHGFLVLPPGKHARPHPVLLAVHGGPHTQYGWGVFDEAQMYAAAGYAVVLPNPRGSSGYGQAHGRVVVGALGTVDASDIMAVLDLALARDDLDAARVGVMGGSYGGFMTSWLASHAAGRFVAGISERGINAWDSFTGSSDIGYYFSDAYIGSSPVLQRAVSPLKYAARIAIPLLIIHSEHDWRCPIEQAQRLYVALKLRGAEVEMLLFPGEGHELSRSGRPTHRVARFEAILDWWARYLPVA